MRKPTAILCVMMLTLFLGGCAGSGAENLCESTTETTVTSNSADSKTIAYDTGTSMVASSTCEGDAGQDSIIECYPDWNTEEYAAVVEHGFTAVASNPYSTFSADVDTASYGNLRRMIDQGYSADEIPRGAVRIEEMLNYFEYDYAERFRPVRRDIADRRLPMEPRYQAAYHGASDAKSRLCGNRRQQLGLSHRYLGVDGRTG